MWNENLKWLVLFFAFLKRILLWTRIVAKNGKYLLYEYRGSIQACRGGVTKPKYIWIWMWQQMWKATRRASRDTSAVKGRLGKMGTYCWVGQGTGWQRAGESPGYLMSSWSLLVRLGIRESKAPETSGKVLNNENLLSVKEDQEWEHLNKPNVYKSVGHDAVHHWPTWLGGHSQFFERLWQSGEAPEDWKKARFIPVFKNGKKRDLGNYRPVRLTWSLRRWWSK